jgi:excisionase family DNA binding protein
MAYGERKDELPTRLLTIEEAAEMLRVAPVTMRRYIATGRLPTVKDGRTKRVQKQDVDRLTALLETEAENHLPDGRPLTYAHPLWALVGSATDAPPTDASRKHEYLADALAPRQP